MKNAEPDALARLLDGDLPEGEATAEARVLSSLARALETSAARPTMASKAELRMALVEAAREQAAAPSLLSRLRSSYDETTSRWRYSMRLAAASGATAMALSSGGVALAAARSMPGDPFYGARLAYEDLRVALIGDPVARAQQLLAYADQRLLEAEIAAEDGDMAAVRRALGEADATSRSAAGYIIDASQDRGDPSLLTILDEFAAQHRKRLTALLPLLGGDAAVAAEDALVSLRRIHQRVAVLSGPCTECDGRTAAIGGTRSSGAEGADQAASDPDFDFSYIPPADEPFAACPCSNGTTTVDRKADKPGDKKPGKGGSTATGAARPSGGGSAPGDGGGDPPPDKPSGGGGEEPGDGPGDDDGGNLPEAPEELPDDVEDPVNDAVDVIEDVLENPPTDLPDLPSDPGILP